MIQKEKFKISMKYIVSKIKANKKCIRGLNKD